MQAGEAVSAGAMREAAEKPHPVDPALQTPGMDQPAGGQDHEAADE
jgi:hypothetical protein